MSVRNPNYQQAHDLYEFCYFMWGRPLFLNLKSLGTLKQLYADERRFKTIDGYYTMLYI